MLAKKMDRRTHSSCRAIATTFFGLVKTKSVSDITVTEICEKADLNRGTFYKYFDNVEDLLCKIKEWMIEDFVAQVEKDVKLNDYPKLIRDCLTMIEIYCDKVPEEFFELRWMEFRNEFMSALQKVMDRYIKGNLSNFSDAKKKTIAIYEMGGVLAVCDAWIRSGKPVEAEELVNYLAEFKRLHWNGYLK